MDDTWDVVVVGGGTAGAATAIALRRAGVASVCVIDQRRSPGGVPPVGESIPPDTGNLLRELGVWDAFIAQGHEPCLGSCSAWGSDVLGYNDFVLNPFGTGWHLDRRRFDALLRTTASASGARSRHGRVVSCTRTPDQFYELAFLDDGDRGSLQARFVVDATGVNCTVARALGAERRLVDRLLFVYGFFEGHNTGQANRLTLLEAAEFGWWYCAKLPNARYAVAFATDSATLRAIDIATEKNWSALLEQTEHLGPRLSQMERVGPLIVRNAPAFVLDPIVGPNWLSVGDAASAYDPIASQGIHKAIEDAIAAAEAIVSGQPLAVYGDIVGSRFEEYRMNRDYLYGLEQRWASGDFWKRRHESAQRPPDLA